MSKTLIDTFLELRQKYGTLELGPLILLRQRPDVILEDLSCLRSSINCIKMHIQNLMYERHNNSSFEVPVGVDISSIPLHKTAFFAEVSNTFAQRLSILENKTKELKFMLYRNAYMESQENASKQLITLFNDIRRICEILKDDEDIDILISYIQTKNLKVKENING